MRIAMKWLFATFVLMLSLGQAIASDLFEQNGKIFHRNERGEVQQVSAEQHNTNAVISPNQKWGAYIHAEEATPDDSAHEIWLVDMDTRASRMVVRSQTNDKPENNLTQLHNLKFSPDGRSLYFMTAAWATSGAVHQLDIATLQQHYVTDGNSLDIIPHGKYAGYLVVTKHIYLRGGGSVENYCLLKPNGRQVKCAGDSEKDKQHLLTRH